jgi:hypothetical protein
MVRRRNRVADGIIGAGSAGTVIAAISAMNDDVRLSIIGLVTGDHLGRAASVVAQGRGFVKATTQAVSTYSGDQPILVMFIVAAAILGTIMFKT